jgi:PTH1 family peptidyl-tRNA hydrolase
LGNPGEEYAETRHNVGFDIADRLAARSDCRFRRKLFNRYYYAETEKADQKLFIVKPLTYMNRSGDILTSVIRKSRLKLENILIVCDTLDLPPGNIRLKRKGGHAGHKGLASILAAADTLEIMRLYIGIGKPQRREKTVEYVLGRPADRERVLYESAYDRACSGIEKLLTHPLTQVMNELNRR